MKKFLLMLFMLPCLAFAENNVVNFTGTVMGWNMHETSQSVLDLHKSLPKETPIVIKVNSPGGRVFAGFILMNTMKAVQAEGRKIEVRVTGFCASMCFSIMQVADTRSMFPFALIMQHKVSPAGKAASSLDSMIEKAEAKRIGLNSEYWALISEANIYVGPEKALQLNLIDKVVTPSVSETSEFLEDLKRNKKYLTILSRVHGLKKQDYRTTERIAE